MVQGQLTTFVDIKHLTSAEIHGQFGGKALGLYTAYQLGIPVPQTWLISSEWYSRFCQENPNLNSNNCRSLAESFIQNNLLTAITALPDIEYAVRSSSQFEDTSQQSFAGIFVSELHIKKSNLVTAIATVWASCFAERVIAYFDDVADLKMAVVLQPMIWAKYAGVCFSQHPSPATVLENHHVLIEVAATEGEKIVQGEVTPFRWSANIQQLSSTQDALWFQHLLDSLLLLKRATQQEVDIEFVVDKKQDFFLVQQCPVSAHYYSKTLDLSAYQRAYKRSLWCLDIEMLIEGCSQFLANYLEVPYQIDSWMIMTTNKGTQELWLHKLINQAVINKIIENCNVDEHYLTRMKQRYFLHHERILNQNYNIFFNQHLLLSDRFLNWMDFIRPIQAHYSVPMFMIDALTEILLLHMRKIDDKNAEADLMRWGTAEVRTLSDLLHEELSQIKTTLDKNPLKFSELSPTQQSSLRKLSEQYGFLKVHQVYETGYTAEELLTMAYQLEANLVEARVNYRDLYDKYITNGHMAFIFEQFQQWMNIRNQQMEYLMYAVLRSRPLFVEMSEMIGISVKELWALSKDLILECLKTKNKLLAEKFSTENLAIYREDGKTHVDNQLKIIYNEAIGKNQMLRGKTIFGKGKITAKVKMAFKSGDLTNFYPQDKKYVLVTGMTTPDYVPFLKKNFSALVTDEGGILCHAAIIAREIQMPAIVGTGMATEILTDNMSITIDFDRGEIIIDEDHEALPLKK